MKLSLIICTYMRPHALCVLLDSVAKQIKIPDEILIIDGSLNNKTKEILIKKNYIFNLHYHMVEEEDRGLTKQRNYGVMRVDSTIDIIAFLDDDIKLENDYFLELEKPYINDETVVGVGGCTTNEVQWHKESEESKNNNKLFSIDGFYRKESLRYRIRIALGLVPSSQPGLISTYSHERSVGFLPPSGLWYEVDFMKGGISSFKKSIFNKIGFSTYFEGYGLYEDKDFTLRAGKIAKLIVNTNAKLQHLHDPSGRPNKFTYGKMVIRNGWYVWRVATPEPGINGVLKWYLNANLLTLIRSLNSIVGPNNLEALTETIGRIYGLITLLFNKPKVEK